MTKKLIRLTESDLHRIVKESVQKIINEVRSGEWNQYRLSDFAKDVLHGTVWGNGTIKGYTGEVYKYTMKGRALKVKFPVYDGGPGFASVFIEDEAPNYPEYVFSLDPSDPNENTMIVRCQYDEKWGI